MKVTVLYGGPSAEREVSLVSGAAVIKGLREAGHDVFPADISPADLSALDHPCDVIFPVLHGAFGESGELQEVLEARKLKFVGSGSAASRIGIDKALTKEHWHKAGLPSAPWQIITNPRDLAPIGPCVIKALDSGSSIDVFVCKNPATADADARAAVTKVLDHHPRVLVERFIAGIELTVGLLEEKPLAPIRIVPKGEFFDYEAKYKSGETEHRFDTGLPADIVEKCRALAENANRIVGARDLARVDMIIDADNNPWLLEINTLPGFTPKSLLPEAAAHDGINFVALVDRLVRRAATRAN